MIQIPKNLIHRPFSSTEAIEAGISKSSLTRLYQSGYLERLGRGVYQVSNEHLGENHISEYTFEESNFITASHICGKPSTICLLSALEFYHLTDLITKQTWILVPESKKCTDKNIKTIRSRKPYWDVGIENHQDYSITSIERTLVDSFMHSNMLGKNTATEALKRAVKDLKIKPKNIFEIAKKMNAKNHASLFRNVELTITKSRYLK